MLIFYQWWYQTYAPRLVCLLTIITDYNVVVLMKRLRLVDVNVHRRRMLSLATKSIHYRGS
jgi:hypothetical protein